MPSGATINSSTGAFSWTPDFTEAGTYKLKVVASDGSLSDDEQITITVNNENRALVAQNGSVTTVEDTTSQSFTLSASDADNDSLTYTIVSGPQHGTLNGTGNSRTYTPAANYNGPDSFTFKANDGTVDSNTATVSITVDAVNDAPSFQLKANPDQTVLKDSGPQSVAGQCPHPLLVPRTSPARR